MKIKKIVVFITLVLFLHNDSCFAGTFNPTLLKRVTDDQLRGYYKEAIKNNNQALMDQIAQEVEDRGTSLEGEWYFLLKKPEPGMGPGAGPGQGAGKGPGLGEGTGAGKGQGSGEDAGPGMGAGKGPGQGEGTGTPELSQPETPQEKPVSEEGQPGTPAELPSSEKRLPTPSEPKKMPYPSERVLKTLSAQEISSLSPEQKKRSDELVLNILQEIAQETFIGIPGEKVKVEIERTAKTFTNAYDAYRFYIEELLITKLGMNDNFKKRAELMELLDKPEDQKGSLNNFIENRLTKPSSINMADFLNKFQGQKIISIAQEFVQLLAKVLFSEGDTRDRLMSLTKEIIIDILVSQRPYISKDKIGPASAIISDGQVYELLKKWFNDTYQNIFSQRDKASEETMKLLDELQKKSELTIDDQEKLRQLVEQLEIDALPAGYPLKDLYNDVNMLRINPSFLRFDQLLGVAALARFNKAANPITQATLYPLLLLLLPKDIDRLKTPLTLMSSIQQQLVYDPDILKDLFKEEFITKNPENPETEPIFKLTALEVLQKAIEKTRLLFLQEHKLPRESLAGLIEDKIGQAKSIKQLKDIVPFLRKGGVSAAELKDLEEELVRVDQPNFAKVKAAFGKLIGKSLDENSSKIIEKIFTQAAESAEKIKELGKILTEAREAFKANNGGYIGSMLIKKLQGLYGTKYDNKLMSLDRTPKTVYSLFITLMGSEKNLKQYATLTDFYQWIEPYGILLKVLTQWPDESKPLKDSEPRLDMLTRSLQVMNTGKKEDRGEVCSVIGTEFDAIIHDVFKNKLDDILDAFRIYDLDTALKKIEERFVVSAGIGLENKQPYKRLIATFKEAYAQVVFELFLQQLAYLDDGSGSFIIGGLGLQGGNAARNARIYQAISGLFKPLLSFLQKSKTITELATISNDEWNNTMDAGIKNLKGELTRAIATVGLESDAQEAVINIVMNYVLMVKDALAKLRTIFATKTGGIPVPPSGGPGIPLPPIPPKTPAGPNNAPPLPPTPPKAPTPPPLPKKK